MGYNSKLNFELTIKALGRFESRTIPPHFYTRRLVLITYKLLWWSWKSLWACGGACNGSRARVDSPTLLTKSSAYPPPTPPHQVLHACALHLHCSAHLLTDWHSDTERCCQERGRRADRGVHTLRCTIRCSGENRTSKNRTGKRSTLAYLCLINSEKYHEKTISTVSRAPLNWSLAKIRTCAWVGKEIDRMALPHLIRTFSRLRAKYVCQIERRISSTVTVPVQ